MPPKFDPTAKTELKLRCVGGDPSAGSSLAPKVGPLGLSAKKVGEDIAKSTKDWKGLKVTVKLTIQNRNATVEVIPSASSLIIQALKEPPRDRKKTKNIKHNGNLPLAEVVNIAKKIKTSIKVPREVQERLKLHLEILTKPSKEQTKYEYFYLQHRYCTSLWYTN